jgi:hypothetical protein
VAFVVLFGIAGAFHLVYSRAASRPAPVIGPAGKCLDNYANLKRAGNRVQLYTCNETDAQKWTVNSNSTIVNANGYCLTATGTTKATAAVIDVCNGSTRQNWSLNTTNHTILSAASKLCLDDYANLSRDGNLVQIYTCNGTTAQVWLPQGIDADPVANITAPTNTATVTGKVTVAATASDDKGVASVAFSVDGTTVNTDTTAPYSFSLDTTKYSNATHKLLAKVVDTAGNVGTSAAVSVTVKNVAATVAPAPTSATGTKFGADPTNGATNDGPVQKFGTKASVRIFADTIKNPVHPTGASIVHTSYALTGYGVSRDQALRNLTAGKYDAAIAAAAKATPKGDVIEIVHEADHKITNGDTSFAVVLAAKNHFYTVAKAANPNVLIANTVTGWLTDPKSGGDFQRWGQVKADIIGIDCDGINPTSLPYPNYDDETKAGVAFVKAYAGNGYKYWAVPEFGAARMSGDASGTERVKWMAFNANNNFKANGALYVDWYDYSLSGHLLPLTLTNEINTWKTFVAQN